MQRDPVLILGAGYTGVRLAQALGQAGVPVIGTRRDPTGPPPSGPAWPEEMPLLAFDHTDPQAARSLAEQLPPHFALVHLAPPGHRADAPTEATREMLAAFGEGLRRVIYVSTTGVYGHERVIDEMTPAAPASARGRARLRVEDTLRAADLPVLVLRAPAIYGPHRGVHVRMRKGQYRIVGDGHQLGSRIHVDDLVTHLRAGLERPITGAWPIGDDEPARAIDVAAFVAARLGLPMPPAIDEADAHELMRVTRRVDGSAVRARLGISLRHSSYRRGIPAALEAERR